MDLTRGEESLLSNIKQKIFTDEKMFFVWKIK